jgi:hypothetical protein
MKHVRAWIGAAALTFLAACGGGGNGSPQAPPVQNPPPPPPPVTTAQVDATVLDTLGRAIAAAALSSGSANVNTDAAGRARIPVQTGSERLLRIAKDGFAEQFKVLNLPASTTTASVEAMLIEREAAQTITAIEAGGSASGRHGVRVTFPANALVNAAGQPVNGNVQMLMTPVDVADVDVGAFPGVFEGVPTGGQRQAIVSFGTAELVVRQNGQELNLASGKTAEIELPLYVTKQQDGTSISVGDTIPLWSLNETTGVWQQEGTGTVILAPASPTRLAVRASIAHFSWWNLDHVAERGQVNVTVNAPGVSVPGGAVITVEGNVVAGTGPTSTASATVDLGTASALGVPAGATTRLEATAQFGDQACRGTADVSPANGATVSVTINMTCINVPTPRLVRPADATFTNSQRAVGFQIEVDGVQPDTVALLVDGDSVASFPTQFFYRGFWDSASLPEGSHELAPRATRQGISRNGTAVTVIVDRTAPQMTSLAPSADTEVDRDTVFTVDFDETVTAAPLSVRDFVRLSVVPPGQTEPVSIAIEAELDATGRQLTVRPAQALPIGTASLSWSGLHDAAENDVTGTIAASWNVSRSQRIGSDFDIEQGSMLTLATDSNGVAHLVRRLPGNGDVQVARFDGSEFVPLGPVLNERPTVPMSGAFNEPASIAIGANGVVTVAFEQQDAAGMGIEMLVRSFDGASNSWQTLGTPFAIGRTLVGTQSSRPQLAIDNLNRPVLVFIGSGTSFVLQGRRFEAGAWTSLGNIDSPVTTFAALSLDANGTPAAAYVRGAFGSNAQLMLAAQFNGSAWTPLGASFDSSPSGGIGPPTILHARDGRPWVAWNRANEVRLARFDGTEFVLLTLDPFLESFNGEVGFAFLNGDPVVAGAGAFGAGRIDVRRMRNGVWEPPALILSNGLTRNIPLAPSGNAVLLAQSATNSVGRVVRVEFP